MNGPVPTPGAPRKILLATDLSARGDRALERAVSIAQRNDAALIILHVFEEFDSIDPDLRHARPAVLASSAGCRDVDEAEDQARSSIRSG